MASAANATAAAAHLESSMSHMKSARTDEVVSDIGKNHIENKGETKHQQPTGKRNRGKRKQGKRKDKTADSNGSSRSNCDSHLCVGHRQENEKLIDMSAAVPDSSNRHIASGQCQSELHRHLNNQSQNHVTEPLKALTHLVEKLGVEEHRESPEGIPHSGAGESPLTMDSDVPSAAAALQDGSIDEALAIAKCNSDDEDDADLELPSSLSDFVLGYHDECHYAVTRLPPNDDDIDTIPLGDSDDNCVRLVPYESELQMPDIIRLITKDLSEPYSIYTYRYFIHNWPHLCFLAMHGAKCVGAIVCKLDVHKKMVRRGYIAMLAVDEDYRKKKLGSSLVKKAIRAMVRGECDEVVLETEITNKPALRLYENLGFVRDKRLFRYYLNGVDALRLKLWLQ